MGTIFRRIQPEMERVVRQSIFNRWIVTPVVIVYSVVRPIGLLAILIGFYLAFLWIPWKLVACATAGLSIIACVVYVKIGRWWDKAVREEKPKEDT